MQRINIGVTFVVASVALTFAQTSSPKDVDLVAPDGVKLRATVFAAPKPGPGVILLHMCNTTRKSWEPVARELSEKGINALTIDNRGFGESGGPRFEGASADVRQQLAEKWAGDFDAAYQYFVSQPGLDRSRLGVGGGSCGVDNAVKLAQRHPDEKVLVLLAGTTSVDGFNFVSRRTEMPIFTAAAADDEFNSATLQVMQWFSEISANPRTKFVGFQNGRHGTEIFGPHPELVHEIVAFLVDTLVTSPAGAQVTPRTTPAYDFWMLANQPGGGAKAAETFHEARKLDPKEMLFPELPINLLGYDRLQAGDNDDAIQLFKLNVEAYPASANAEDSLSDAYLATGQKEQALAAEKKCLELLPGDPNPADFKAQLKQHADEKIAQLEAGKK
jgi:dienelactone hydrolase